MPREAPVPSQMDPIAVAADQWIAATSKALAKLVDNAAFLERDDYRFLRTTTPAPFANLLDTATSSALAIASKTIRRATEAVATTPGTTKFRSTKSPSRTNGRNNNSNGDDDDDASLDHRPTSRRKLENNHVTSLGNVFDTPSHLASRYTLAVDATDILLEKVDSSIDTLTRALHTADNGQASAALSTNLVNGDILSSSSSSTDKRTQTAHDETDGNKQKKRFTRPQDRFANSIDNSINTPWKPILKDKPNALVQPSVDSDGNPVFEVDKSPYASEIHALRNGLYDEALFVQTDEILYEPIDDSEATFIDTLEQLQEVATVLLTQKEIAVDLEHHSQRSFQGFTCLMQISTRTQDYLIDTIALREHMSILNSSFTNPHILKVFHGANMDIMWLQRDFGIYVVNMFDTYQASKVLGLPRHSLAFLLEQYCQVHADKQHQLSDWRIRPLTEAMLAYARADTHYLLYIFDRMKNQLVNLTSDVDLEADFEAPTMFKAKNSSIQQSNPQSAVAKVLRKSEEVCLQVYTKPVYDFDTGEGPGGWRKLLQRLGGGSASALDYRQLEVFKRLHRWRDRSAREEDESTNYVLPNHLLLSLAQALPVTSVDILHKCLPHVPIFVKMRANELARLVEDTIKFAERARAKLEEERRELHESIRKREREWLERVAKGPTHIRFSQNNDDDNDDILEGDDDTTNDTNNQSSTPIHTVGKKSNLIREDTDENLELDFPVSETITALVIPSTISGSGVNENGKLEQSTMKLGVRLIATGRQDVDDELKRNNKYQHKLSSQEDGLSATDVDAKHLSRFGEVIVGLNNKAIPTNDDDIVEKTKITKNKNPKTSKKRARA